MTTHCKTIFLGDVQEYLSILATKYDATAYLLDQSNADQFRKNHIQDIVVYTSLGDLSKDLSQVFDLLSCADTIFYCPPTIWSDKKTIDITDPTSSVQGLTETLLQLLPSSVKVNGLPNFDFVKNNPIVLSDLRKTDQPQLWIAGCSVSHGIGVEKKETYGALLADTLKLECSFLTKSGTAINWAADQILRSDIRSGDIVVWGVTEWSRLTHVHNHQLLQGVNIRSYDLFPDYYDIISIDNLFSHQTYYNHLYSIQQVINYCQKIGAKLLLVGILSGNFALVNFLKSQKNYIHIPYQIAYQENMLLQQFVDLGSDSMHPGPKQHQEYKKDILNFIKYHNL